MNIEIGGNYSAQDRQGRTIFIEVLAEATEGKYLCKRIENGRELVLTKKNIKAKIGRSNGDSNQPKNSEGLQEPIGQPGLPIGEGSGSEPGEEPTPIPVADCSGGRTEEEKTIGTKYPKVDSDKIRENGELVFLTVPIRSENELAIHWSWWSECGRYSIIHTISKLKGGVNHFALWGRNEENIHLLVDDLHSIRLAAKAAVEVLAVKCGLEEPGKVNAKDLSESFKNLEAQGGPEFYNEGFEKWLKEGERQPYQQEPPEIEEDDAMVNIREKAARGIGTKLGIESPDLEALQTSLNRIGDFVSEELESQLTQSEKKTIDSLRKANSEGKEIKIVSDSPKKKAKAPKAKAKPKEKASKAPKVPKAPKVKAAPKEKKPKAERGLSQLDAAHKVLSDSKKESMTAPEIHERMIEKGLWKSKGKTPINTLSAHIGKDARFKRIARGQIALA